MQIGLELLAPAKNKDIGIAAIDCGADAVYIAGPRFGARESAGNSFSDIAELVSYAHRFCAKVYLTLNTILYENELEPAKKMIEEARHIGCDAVIIQDLGILEMDLPPVPLLASTQTDIRTPEQARLLESLGLRRLILARELSLEQITRIRQAVSIPLETFIHGALCVSYSGQCYLSQYLTGRSANRGACAQPCRNDYTLEDGNGRVLVKDSPLLSLKDFNLENRIGSLAEAGVTSFKIEGRLKNISYIKNIVLHYRRILDKYILEHPRYVRSSLGECCGGFTPRPALTFNRGYTELFLSGKRSFWRSADGAKYLGEFLGYVSQVSYNRQGMLEFRYAGETGEEPSEIRNGDGLCFITPGGGISGARANSCTQNKVSTTEKIRIPVNTKIYRNYNIAFEKELENNMPRRLIPAALIFTEGPDGYELHARIPAFRPDTLFCGNGFSGSGREHQTPDGFLPPEAGPDGNTGIRVVYRICEPGRPAENPELAANSIRSQLSKTAGIFTFNVEEIRSSAVPFFPAAVLNRFRRETAELIRHKIEETRLAGRRQEEMEIAVRQRDKQAQAGETPGNLQSRKDEGAGEDSGDSKNSENRDSRRDGLFCKSGPAPGSLSYLGNCSNTLSGKAYNKLGIRRIDPAYELKPVKNAELMRTKYCIKYELGLCPKNPGFKTEKAAAVREPLFLINGKNRLRLKFDCKNCEMVIIG